METRYLGINTCKGCPHQGHTVSAGIEHMTTFCGYPENMKIENLQKISINNGEYYPITALVTHTPEVEIPPWCKLPSKVVD